MKLSQVTGFFNSVEVLEGTTLNFVAKGQLELYDDSVRDGVGVDRRVLQTKPGTLLPHHLRIGDSDYVLGEKKTDHFRGSAIRDKWVLQEAPYQLSVNTFHGHLSGTEPGQFAAGGAWLKGQKLETWSSDPRPMYVYYVTALANIKPDHVFLVEDRWYRVKSAARTFGGFLMLEVTELPDNALSTLTVRRESAAYNPVTDTYADAVEVDVQAFLLHFYDDYLFSNATMSDWKSGYEPGDMRFRFLSEAVPSVNADDILKRDGRTWRVISAYKAGDATWSVHAREVTG